MRIDKKRVNNIKSLGKKFGSAMLSTGKKISAEVKEYEKKRPIRQQERIKRLKQDITIAKLENQKSKLRRKKTDLFDLKL